MLAWFEEGFQFEVTEVMLEFLFSWKLGLDGKIPGFENTFDSSYSMN